MHEVANQQQDRVHRSALTKWEIIVVVGILAVLVALILPTVRRSKEVARRAQCRSNLKQIGLALHNYHDEYQSFPPAWTVDAIGKRLHSWRTLILPYLDQQNLYETIDLSKPWNDPANASAYETTIPAYTCPGATNMTPGHTTYLGLIGSDRFFPPMGSRRLSELKSTSQTLMVIDVPPDRSVHWMEPRDEDGQFILTLNENTKTNHTDNGAIEVLFADTSVRLKGGDWPLAERRYLLSVSNSETTTESTTQP